MIACILAVVGPPGAIAQEDGGDYAIDAWTTDEGLPQSTVTAIVQSEDGYLWLGTFGGLVRFDGARMTVYDRGNTPALPGSAVVNLHLDRQGRLWVSTDAGLVVQEAGGWRAVEAVGAAPGGQISSFAERSNGDLLLTGGDGCIWEIAGDAVRELPPLPRPTRIDLTYAAVDDAERWWVTRAPGAFVWDGTAWSEPLGELGSEPGRVAAATSRQGGVWVLARDQLYRFRAGEVVTRSTLPEPLKKPWRMSEDAAGNLWIATEDAGLFRVSPDGQVRSWLSGELSGRAGPLGIRCVLEDREGNLWVGTSSGGLQRLRTPRFRGFGSEHGLQHPQVQSVCADAAGGLWLATFGGGLAYMRDGRFERVPLAATGAGPEYLNAVLQDRRGAVWIGTLGAGLWTLDSAGARRVEGAPGIQDVFSGYEDAAGRVWTGGRRALAFWDGRALNAVRSESGADAAGVRWFAEDRDGVLWAASESHIYRWESERLVELPAGSGPRQGLTFLAADQRGIVWIGRPGHGLQHYDRGWSSPVPIPTHLGSVGGLADDGRGSFWLSTSRGVARVERASLLRAPEGGPGFRLYDRSDGLPSAECASGRHGVAARDHRGRLWFATLKGVAVVDPSVPSGNAVAPRVLIESLRYYDGGSAPGASEGRFEAPFPASLDLPKDTGAVEVTYTATSLSAPQKVRFEMRLEGRQRSGWRPMGDRRQALFSGLSAGRYVFSVRAVNEDGVPSEAPATLAFVIRAPFWQRGGVQAGMVVALVGVAGGGVWWLARLRLARLTAQLQLKEQREQLIHLSRVVMLGELSGSMAHELNQPLASILSNAQAAQRFLGHNPPDLDEVEAILKDIVSEDERAGEIIRRLRLLLRKGEVQYQALDLNEAVQDVLRLMRSDLINHRVTVQADLAPGLPKVRADRIEIQQVLLNLISNGCEAMADVAADDDRVLIVRTAPGGTTGMVEASVVDRGQGIPPDRLSRIFDPFFTTKREGLGIGLAVCRTIITTHGGKAWATNNPARGATVHFSLPVDSGAAA